MKVKTKDIKKYRKEYYRKYYSIPKNRIKKNAYMRKYKKLPHVKVKIIKYRSLPRVKKMNYETQKRRTDLRHNAVNTGLKELIRIDEMLNSHKVVIGIGERRLNEMRKSLHNAISKFELLKKRKFGQKIK